MTLRLAFRLARRELRGGVAGFRIFLACLAIGVAAVAGAGSLDRGLRAALAEDARMLLGGDLEARLVQREATGAERRGLERAGRLSETIEMRSMVRAIDRAESRTLVELKGVDGAYPLVGAMELSPARPLAEVLERQDGTWGAAVDPVLLVRLGLRVGDRVQVGEATFRVRAVIVREPDRVANALALGPRLLVARAAVDETGLVRPGSLTRSLYRMALPPGVSPERERDRLTRDFPTSGWEIRGRDEAAPGVQTFLGNMTLFLTLVGLTALLVGGIGIANAVKAYLDGRIRTLATLKCVGATGGTVFGVYLIQIAVLAAAGIAIGLALGAAGPLLGNWLLGDSLPVRARFDVYAAPLALAAGFGALTAALFALWPLGMASGVPAAALFRDVIGGRRSPGWTTWAGTGLLAAALAVLTVLSAERRDLAGWFVVAAAVSMLLFFLAAKAVKLAAAGIAARRRTAPGRTAARLALAGLHRPGAATTSVTLSLGLGLTVLVAVAQIEGNLDLQIESRLPREAPAFFFIDIQPDQVADFVAAVHQVPEAAGLQLASMARGRIVRIDGLPVNAENVAPPVRWAVRGDRGFTTSVEPPPGTRLTEGRWWDGEYRGPPLISVAADVAHGMGLKVGKTLTVNLLGREITGTVANLRETDWSSLGLNFAFVFSPGTLEGAPATFIATVHVPPQAEDALERAVTDRLANVSAIRVRQALEAVGGIVRQAGAAIRAAAAASLLAGILVLAGAIAAGHRRRVYESVVMKVLGATRRDVLAAYLLEYGLLGTATGLIAAILGAGAAWAVVTLIMNLRWTPLPEVILTTTLSCILLTLAAGFVGTWRALGAKAAPFLRNE